VGDLNIIKQEWVRKSAQIVIVGALALLLAVDRPKIIV
jgi:hypothetical protein